MKYMLIIIIILAIMEETSKNILVELVFRNWPNFNVSNCLQKNSFRKKVSRAFGKC